MQRVSPPERYLGIDLLPGLIRWCEENLTPRNPSFRFRHHDDYYPPFNPGCEHPMGSAQTFPAEDGGITLVLALSVFTHLVELQAMVHLAEVARVLDPEGNLVRSWLLLEKANLPALAEDLNALYISYEHPTGAVYFDRQWVQREAAKNGLVSTRIDSPATPGLQWLVVMRPATSGVRHVHCQTAPDRVSPCPPHACSMPHAGSAGRHGAPDDAAASSAMLAGSTELAAVGISPRPGHPAPAFPHERTDHRLGASCIVRRLTGVVRSTRGGGQLMIGQRPRASIPRPVTVETATAERALR